MKTQPSTNNLGNLKKITDLAILGGIAGPIVMIFGMFVAALAYVGVEGQKFSIFNHFVSELGEVGVSELAWVFNYALTIGGIITTSFMLVLAYQIKSWLRYPLGILGAVSTLSGALVGIFPMNNLQMHTTAAMFFFNLGMLVSFAYSLVFLSSKQLAFPKWLSVPGFINAGLFTWFLNFPPSSENSITFEEGMLGLIHNRPDFLPMALLEWAIVLGIIAWILILGVYMYNQRRSEKKPAGTNKYNYG